MRRRDLLAAIGGAFAAGPLAAHGAWAQATPNPRAAIVIGVDRPEGLPVLRAAASGAREVEKWLGAEGYFVQSFIDDAGPVRAHGLYDAIAALIEPGNLDQLVVYFAGHGFLNAGRNEMWLLSEAPRNASEAVDLEDCVFAARESGAKNVVFISDACRSTPDSLKSSRMRGYQIFPNLDVARRRRPDVDQFFATLPGKESNEAPVSESAAQFEGIYTTALIAAFQSPQGDIVRAVNGVNVVSTRMLKAYLAQEVPKRAQAKSLRLNQRPESIIESDSDAFIAKAAAIAVPAPPDVPEPAPVATIGHLVDSEFKLAGLTQLSLRLALPTAVVAAAVGGPSFRSAQNIVRDVQIPDNLMVASGVAVVGADLKSFVGGPRTKTERRPWDDEHSAYVQVDLGEARAGSLVVAFAEGGGTVVAALPGFVATVVVERGLVSNVSYVPTRDSFRWQEYASEGPRIDDLRATVAASAQFGEFRIEGDREARTRKARDIADKIRVGKVLDPTLGLYAAYAYAGADIMDQVLSVRDFMRGDLRTVLFDVAMLANERSKPFERQDAFPFCPMLSQGWSLLRVKGVRLAPEAEAARDHLLPALWTTFDSEAIDALGAALAKGRLT